MFILFLIFSEFYHNPEQWQKVRGPEMLVVMKVVSIAFDMDRNVLKQLPSCSQYCGYVLCVGTSVFGAWVSYDDYQNIFHNPRWVSEEDFYYTSFYFIFFHLFIHFAFYTEVILTGDIVNSLLQAIFYC